jgi:hypothetical protein
LFRSQALTSAHLGSTGVQIGGQNSHRQSAAVVAMGMLSKMRVLLEKQAPQVLAFVAGLIVLAAHNQVHASKRGTAFKSDRVMRIALSQYVGRIE